MIVLAHSTKTSSECAKFTRIPTQLTTEVVAPGSILSALWPPRCNTKVALTKAKSGQKRQHFHPFTQLTDVDKLSVCVVAIWDSDFLYE